MELEHSETIKTKAEMHYEKYLTYKRKYYQENRDKVNGYSKKWFRENIMGNPEKYSEYLNKKREQYQKRKLLRENSGCL